MKYKVGDKFRHKEDKFILTITEVHEEMIYPLLSTKTIRYYDGERSDYPNSSMFNDFGDFYLDNYFDKLEGETTMIHIEKLNEDLWPSILDGTKKLEIRKMNKDYINVGDKIQFVDVHGLCSIPSNETQNDYLPINECNEWLIHKKLGKVKVINKTIIENFGIENPPKNKFVWLTNDGDVDFKIDRPTAAFIIYNYMDEEKLIVFEIEPII